MSENLKELLEKINQEGIKLAEEKARAIEDKAGKNAGAILEEAKKQADSIVKEANADGQRIKAAAEASLRQASRDILLSLKDEIKKILAKVVEGEIKKSMSQEDIGKILSGLIERYIEKNGQASDIKALVKKEDLEKIESIVLSKLKDRIKSGVEFRPSPNITAGFSISFDKGKSYFDFSDEGLLETLCAYLNPELAKIIA